MFKYTKHTLGKLEDLFKEQEYVVRYEKGNFQSGYCLVEDKKIVIINKFYEVEGRINALLEIMGMIEFDESRFSEKPARFYAEVMREKENEDENKA